MMRFPALASVIATVLIGPLQAPAQAQETIRIGVLEPMTGPANKNGIENYTAMEIARDMIERREAQQALYESERRFRLLIQAVKDYAIYMLDPSGVIVNWNSGAERLKGYSAAEIVGQHF